MNDTGKMISTTGKYGILELHMDEKSSRGKKREITKEEISNYIDQGYYFRVKKVNGKNTSPGEKDAKKKAWDHTPRKHGQL